MSLKVFFRRLAPVGYVPVLAAAMAFMFIRTLLAARLLSVPEFGLFGVGVLVSNSFCMLGCFGFYLLLQRELPMLIAKGRHTRGAMLLHQTLVLALIGFVASLPLSWTGIFSVSPVFFAIALLNGFAQQAFLVVTLQSRSEGRSMRFAIDNLARAAVVLAVIALSGWISGEASSMLLAESFVTLAMVAWLYSVIVGMGTNRRMVLWVGAVKALSRVRWWSPLTLMAIGVVGFAMLNGDRWLAASWLSRDNFALYTFGGVILTLALSLQSVINVSVFPTLAKTYALYGNATTASKAVRYSMVALSGAVFLSIPAFYLIGEITEIFFQEYASIREFLALFLLIFALHVSNFLSCHLIIAKRERFLLGINIASFCLSSVVWLVFFASKMTSLRTVSIAWLATLIAAFNYTGCLLAVLYSRKSG